MSQFFDDKEEVLDFKLTEWGEYMFRLGKLKPAKYAFYDDGVLYDSEYAGVSGESQKDIQERILNETPRIKTITKITERKNYFSEYDNANSTDVPSYANPLDSLTNTTLIERIINEIDNPQPNQKEVRLKNLVLQNVLGSSKINSELQPAFNVNFLKGEISSSSDVYETSLGTYNIPQINVNLEYKITIGDGFIGVPNIEEELDLRSEVLEDGTFIAVEPDFLLVDIVEENTNFENDNITIEIFEVIDANEMRLKSLKMIKQPDNIDENGFLVENTSIMGPFLPDQNPDKNDLDYYFNLTIDDNIQKELICSLVNGLKKKGHNLRILEETYDCEKFSKQQDINIYDQEGIEINNCPDGNQ